MKNLLLLLFTLPAFAQQPAPVARWSFDSIAQTETQKPLARKEIAAPEIYRQYTTIETLSGAKSQILGAFHKSVPGVVGNALQLDGNTSFVQVTFAETAPINRLKNEFSVGAWLALGAYPTNWCPVADQQTATGKGFFLGIDAHGHAGFKAFVGGNWVEITSSERIPLRAWAHLQGVFSPETGLVLYLNGKPVASAKTTGNFDPATNQTLLIGRHSILQKPEGTVRPNATAAVYTFLDGIIDELHIFDKAPTAADVAAYWQQTNPKNPPVLPARTLPLAGARPEKFGAVYTKLAYYEAWDKLWPVNEQADVVVQFDNSPAKFVFWRGTSYIPHWITENGIWYNNEFLETWSARGSHEPMSDKRCQFSHVRVIENTDARVVIHWRYALIDNWNEMARVDSLTGFGEWADELYTIYPDGIGVRAITLHSSQPQSAHEWNEGIVVMGPGQRPEQVLEPGALTLANMAGQTHTYSWANGIPKEAGKFGYVSEPAGANIHVVNTKSRLKPFYILSPAAHAIFDIYYGELRREVSMFPWWNHWPAAQKASDGRYAMDADYASHSSLSHATWDAYQQTDNSMTKLMLQGLSDQTPGELVNLANAWANPARLKINNLAAFSGGGYDPAERAYQISCQAKGQPATLTFSIEASSATPVQNLAIVVKNWGNRPVSALINSKRVLGEKAFRYGFRDTLNGTDLLVWIELKAIKPLAISLIPGKN
jgi:hypothetical protein